MLETLLKSMLGLIVSEAKLIFALRSIGWELPGHVPLAATNELVQGLTCLWHEPSLSCFNDVYAMTTRAIDGLGRKHFGQFSNAVDHIRCVSSTLLTMVLIYK